VAGGRDWEVVKVIDQRRWVPGPLVLEEVTLSTHATLRHTRLTVTSVLKCRVTSRCGCFR
jgi:hypothetical protein